MVGDLRKGTTSKLLKAPQRSLVCASLSLQPVACWDSRAASIRHYNWLLLKSRMSGGSKVGLVGSMASSSDSKRSLSGRIWPLVVAVVVAGLLVFFACLMVWYHFGGGAWRSGVSVVDARLDTPDTLILAVESCHGAPRVAMSHETDVAVYVRIIAFSTPMHGGLDCLDSVNVYLEEPLGDRVRR